MESILGYAQAPSWSSSTQAASLTNALVALTMVGVPVAHTTLDEVVQKLPRVVTATTTAQRAEVEFTLRLRNCRPRIVDNKEENNTFEVRFVEKPAAPQHAAQVEPVLLAIYSGPVTLEPVPEKDFEAMQQKSTPAPVPRTHSPEGAMGIQCSTL